MAHAYTHREGEGPSKCTWHVGADASASPHHHIPWSVSPSPLARPPSARPPAPAPAPRPLIRRIAPNIGRRRRRCSGASSSTSATRPWSASTRSRRQRDSSAKSVRRRGERERRQEKEEKERALIRALETLMRGGPRSVRRKVRVLQRRRLRQGACRSRRARRAVPRVRTTHSSPPGSSWFARRTASASGWWRRLSGRAAFSPARPSLSRPRATPVRLDVCWRRRGRWGGGGREGRGG